VALALAFVPATGYRFQRASRCVLLGLITGFETGVQSQAAAALKRLRGHSDDKAAADALERAVRQLKERTKPTNPQKKKADTIQEGMPLTPLLDIPSDSGISIGGTPFPISDRKCYPVGHGRRRTYLPR
jgi:hypothetical protein